MSNSSLVNYKIMSPNHSGARTHKIDRITPHCVVGQISAQSIGSCFTSSSRQASCNYGIGTNGDVVLVVDEANRSWCSSSNANDQRAITIECASDTSEPYTMNLKVYNKLVDLCVDICKRNGIHKLLWLGSKDKTLAYTPKPGEVVLTAHRWFANKSCPGDWLYSRYSDLAYWVNLKLGQHSAPAPARTQPAPSCTLYRVQTGAFYAKANAAELPWKELGVDVVLECTGFYTSKAKSQAHIDAGAKKVVISAPAGKDLPTIVFGVNENTLKASDTIISAASCTTNCLAPMADALNKLAPIEKAYMVTIHAYTGDQMTLDGPHRKGDLRRARAAAVNIVPNSTGAAKAIGLVIPELAGKLDGAAQRVPVPTGSTTILTSVVNKEVTAEEVNAAMKAAANASYGYTEDEIVSSDIIGITYGSLFDATQTKVMELENGKTLVKTVSWYDNENSYTSQMVRTIKYFAELA